jgi:hypothetical protein
MNNNVLAFDITELVQPFEHPVMRVKQMGRRDLVRQVSYRLRLARLSRARS